NGNLRAQYGCGGSTSICPPSPPCTPGSCGQSAAFVGPAGVGGMTTNSHAAFVQDAYDNLATQSLYIGGPYYDQSWTVLSLLMMTGNYLNFAPQPTPTPTPDACQYAIRVNAAGSAQGLFAADQEYGGGNTWGFINPPGTNQGVS